VRFFFFDFGIRSRQSQGLRLVQVRLTWGKKYEKKREEPAKLSHEELSENYYY